MREIILINITGEDGPGLTHALTGILDQYNVQILDIGQEVIHDMLSLGILIGVPETAGTSPVLKDLLFKAHEHGLHLVFTPVSEKEYEEWVSQQGKPRYILTLLARAITASHLANISGILSAEGLNIDRITRLSGRPSLRNQESRPRACIELSVRGQPKDAGDLRRSLLELTHSFGIDIAFQEDNLYRRHKRLVCFDMDSTLIQTEVIDELAGAAGVKEQVSAITEAAMRGELDFSQSLRQRVKLLKGLDASVMAEIAENLPLTEGAERLIGTLKDLGYSIAILSGGFTYFGEYLKRKLGIDYVFANELEIIDGRLTGEVIEPIVDAQRKADLLRTIAQQERIQLAQVIAVGDGANDLAMLNLAGTGIAFRAKTVVKENADHAISALGLDALLYLLGMRDRDITR